MQIVCDVLISNWQPKCHNDKYWIVVDSWTIESRETEVAHILFITKGVSGLTIIMANNSMGQAANMPTIGNLNQGAIQYTNNPLQSPQLQSTAIQGSPTQHSPMGTQSQAGAKANQSGAGDQISQVSK